jgi:WD40 repeat protein
VQEFAVGQDDGGRGLTLLPGDRTLFRCEVATHEAEFWDLKTAKKTGGFALGEAWLTQDVRTAAVSADGHRLLTAQEDGYVCLWDLKSNQRIWRVPVRSAAHGLAFSLDGRYAAAGLAPGEYCVWRLPPLDGPVPPEPAGWPDPPAPPSLERSHVWNYNVYHAAYSPNGKYYLAASEERRNQVRVWKAQTGELVRVLPGCQCAQFTPDGKQVLAWSRDNMLHLWDLETGQEVRQLIGHKDGLTRFELSPDGKRVVSCARDQTIRLWDLTAGQELARLPLQDEWSRAVFSPDGGRILTWSGEGTVHLYDADGLKRLRSWTLPGNEAPVQARFVPGGKGFVAVSLKAVHWYDIDRDEEPRPAMALKGLADADGWWWGLSEDATRLILSPKAGQTLRVLELPSGRPLMEFTAPAELFGPCDSSPFGIPALSPDGRRLVVAARWDYVGRVYVFRMPDAAK